MRRMEKARKKASNIIENEDLGSREKMTEIKKLYKKASQGDHPYIVLVESLESK